MATTQISISRSTFRSSTVSRIGLVAMLIALGGCQSWVNGVQNFAAPAAGAAPLDIMSFKGNLNSKDNVLHAIGQSQSNCLKYKRTLSVAQRASNGVFDIITTALAGLATVFTPLSTVHILTAAATISSGTKGAIDTNFYQGETTAYVIAAIQKTYDAQIATLLAHVEGEGKNEVIESVDDVQQINTLCSLTEALGAGTGTTPQNPTPPVTATDITNGANFATPGGVAYSITSAPDVAGNVNYSETVSGKILTNSATTNALAALLTAQQATKK